MTHNCNDETNKAMKAHEVGSDLFGRYYCRRCADEGNVVLGYTRHSLGIYAGTYCDEHWLESGYRDEGPEGFDPDFAGERYEEN